MKKSNKHSYFIAILAILFPASVYGSAAAGSAYAVKSPTQVTKTINVQPQHVKVRGKSGKVVNLPLKSTTNLKDLQLVTRGILADNINVKEIPADLNACVVHSQKNVPLYDEHPLRNEFITHYQLLRNAASKDSPISMAKNNDEVSQSAQAEWNVLKVSAKINSYMVCFLSVLVKKEEKKIRESDAEILDTIQAQTNSALDSSVKKQFIDGYSQLKANIAGIAYSLEDTETQWNIIKNQFQQRIETIAAEKHIASNSNCLCQ